MVAAGILEILKIPISDVDIFGSNDVKIIFTAEPVIYKAGVYEKKQQFPAVLYC